MANVPSCWVCARSGISASSGNPSTNWSQDHEHFWRCNYGHLANIEQVKQLNALKAEAEKKAEQE